MGRGSSALRLSWSQLSGTADNRKSPEEAMTEWKYLPILKWNQGERIALRNLKGSRWDGLVPLIELLVDAHLELTQGAHLNLTHP
jgi:hypothetical protein